MYLQICALHNANYVIKHLEESRQISIKRVLSIILSLLMIVTMMPLGSVTSVYTNATTIDSGSDSTIHVGDCITLGTYNGKPIVWRCVLIDENGPLMLSEDILCNKEYDAAGDNTKYHSDSWSSTVRRREGSNNWQDSNIRQWLNTYGTVEYTHCPPSYSSEKGFLSNFTQQELNYVKKVTHNVTLVRYDASRAGYCDGGYTDYFNPMSKDFNINKFYVFPSVMAKK